MHASNALGFSGLFCLLVLCGNGCVGTSQQQPQQAATTAVTGDNSRDEYNGDAAKAKQAALYAPGPSVAVTPRGQAIEDDLNGRFARSVGDP